MIKAFLKDSLIYTASTLLARGMGFFLIPLYTYFLSPESFGTIDYLNAIGAIIAVTVTLEITQALYRYIPDFQRKASAVSALFTVSFVTIIGLHSLLVIGVWLSADALSILLFETNTNTWLLKLCAILFTVNAIVNLVNAYFVASLQSKRSLLFSALSAFITALLSSVLLALYDYKAEGVIIGQIVGGSAAVVCFWRFMPALSNSFSFCTVFTKLVSFSLPLIPSSVGVIVATFADRLMIKELLTLEDLGVYGVALRISMFLTLLTVGVRNAITPLIYNHYKYDATRQKIVNILYIYLGFSLLGIVVLHSIDEFLILLLSNDAYLNATDALLILCVSVIIANIYVFLPGLSINKKTGLISVINISGLIVNIPLNILLIPKLGIKGAAIATLATSLFTLVLHYIYSQKEYYLPINKLATLGFVASSALFLLWTL